MHQPKQLHLFEFPTQPQIKVTYDPYWDELETQADDIVEQAFLSINAEDEIFDVDAETAHQQKPSVGEQLPDFSSPSRIWRKKMGVTKNQTLAGQPSPSERLRQQRSISWGVEDL